MRSGLIELTLTSPSLLGEPPAPRGAHRRTCRRSHAPRRRRARPASSCLARRRRGRVDDDRAAGPRGPRRRPLSAAVFPVDAQTTPGAPTLERARDGDRHAAILERASRVRALPLDPELDTEPCPTGAAACRSGVEPSPSVTVITTPRSVMTRSASGRACTSGRSCDPSSAAATRPDGAVWVTTSSAALPVRHLLRQLGDRDAFVCEPLARCARARPAGPSTAILT